MKEQEMDERSRRGSNKTNKPGKVLGINGGKVMRGHKCYKVKMMVIAWGYKGAKREI